MKNTLPATKNFSSQEKISKLLMLCQEYSVFGINFNLTESGRKKMTSASFLTEAIKLFSKTVLW
jgi:hypothetical protein